MGGLHTGSTEGAARAYRTAAPELLGLEMQSARTEGLAPVLRALRRVDDEVQLTRTFAAFASDGRFAAGLAKALLNSSPHPNAGRLVDELPDVVSCEAERVFDGLGRVDLYFANEPERFRMIVEAKLSATYEVDQLSRYCAALAKFPVQSSGVLAIRRSAAVATEEEAVERDQVWRGAARWSQALPFLRSLEHPDPVMDAAWKEFLVVLESEGEFGLVTLEREAIEGWGMWLRGRDQLRGVLEELSEPALQVIRSELPATFGALPEDRAAPLRRREWEDKIFIPIAIPAAAKFERLWLEFVGGPHISRRGPI